MQTQREAQQANELSNLTRQRQLLASVNNRRAIIEELERLPGNFVACKTTEHLKRIQKAIFVEVIDLKKELRLQMEMANTRLIIASPYNRVVISLANGGNVGGCTTTFSLWSSPPQSEPHETIGIAHVYGNHLIKAALREGCPLPMTHPLWRTYRSDIASRWEDPYVSRQEEFREHYYSIPEFFDLSK
ncbi:hypothetical protein Tco_0576004 [Tanacetum coccineum]